MSAPPFMPLYVADYLADTTHLSTLEHGAYCLLLMSMWRNGGSLPDGDAKLAKFARMTPSQWSRVRDSVMQFFDVSDGVVTQRRLAVEIEKHANVVRQRRESGSLGGKAKALKDNKPNLAPARDLLCQPEPEPEPERKTPPTPKGEKEGLAERQFEAFWESYPKKRAKPEARKAFMKALKRASVHDIAKGLKRDKVSVDWLKDDGQFIPYPASWLNASRWEDENVVLFHPAFSEPKPVDTSDPWPARARAWIEDTGWPTVDWGPNPDSPGCEMPRRYIDEQLAAGVKWAPHLKMAAE